VRPGRRRCRRIYGNTRALRDVSAENIDSKTGQRIGALSNQRHVWTEHLLERRSVA
jgi:hypothetical protein